MDIQEKKGELNIVPTPIGNLEDITLRALKILNKADLICCEDTREISKVLNHYKIFGKKLEIYHEHNEESKSNYIIHLLKTGKTLALVSDAGTPCISDPGYRLVKMCIDNNINVVPLPGASSFLTALSASGLPTDRFTFFGFPPQKKGRDEFFSELIQHPYTSVIFESPHRIEKLFYKLIENKLEDRKITVCRELTKKFEDIFHGSVSEALKYLTENNKIRGEFVIVLSGTNAK